MILTSEIEGKVLRFRDHPDKRNCILTFFADFSEDSIDELLMKFNCPSVALRVDDWNEELSPWRMPAIFGNDDFGDGAENTLEFILDRVIPLSVKELSLKDDTRFIIGGYSLAALFSLWSCFRTDRFFGVAAASPSVWFDGWIEYVGENHPKTEYVFLSLGDTESKTKNRYLSRVSDNINKTHDIISQYLGEDHCELIWNDGGHFKDVTERASAAFEWILDRSIETYDPSE